MKTTAILVAGGSGQRMGTEVPKQFLLLRGKPVLWHTVKAFADTFPDIEIIVVLPEAHDQRGREILADLAAKYAIRFTTGGDSRFQSVKNGLALVDEPAVVFVHDAVRCLVTPALLQQCYRRALEKGSAIPVVSATDSIRILTDGVHSVIDRNSVLLVQTPQTFRSNLLLPAFEQPYSEAFTDEATVVEAYGTPVELVQGEYDNIKITRPADMLIAEKILEARLTVDH